jgi:hypothetical protein
MLSDLVGLVATMAPVVFLLVWTEHAERRQQRAWMVRAEIDAGARRALGGDSMLAIDVDCPTPWRAGEVRVGTPSGYESLLCQAAHEVLARVPHGYDVIIHCGGGA